MTNPRGIDISRWQGKFPWHNHPGLSFGMAKATEGLDVTDPEFGNNWDGMWNYRPDHRLPRFAYHYFRAAAHPEDQARFFVQTVKQHGLVQGDNFVFDNEATREDGSNDGMHPSEVARRGVIFLHHVNALAPGHRVLNYSNTAYIKAGNCAGMSAWHLWVADYGVLHPEVADPWVGWTFWQDGDQPIDTDEFNGTEDQLRAFTRMPDKR